MASPTQRPYGVACIAALAALSSAAAAQITQRYVDPLATDPAIAEVDLPFAEGVPLEHYVALAPNAPDNGRLFVWLAGTGGAAGQYATLSNVAAHTGFDVVGLIYDSWPAVNLFTTNSTDPELGADIRRERLFGVNATPVIDVDQPNSVVNRLAKLLEHQAQNHPTEDWASYLLPNGQIDWSRVVVGGHSQGAGHAVFLSKEFRLAGALIFAGPGDFVQGSGTAPWVLEPGLTPAEDMYALTHVQDPTSNGFFEHQRILGLETFGLLENVDGKTVQQINSHMLTSTIPVEHGNYHSAIAVDIFLPLTPGGVSVYEPAWRSMFTRVVPGPCSPADLTSVGMCEPELTDGVVSLDDFACYLSQWSLATPIADITAAGACAPGTGGDGVDLSDFACYLTIWSVGCP